MGEGKSGEARDIAGVEAVGSSDHTRTRPVRIVFNAANSLEAHMIKELLNMQGIEAHINGEHLQSGVGELPAINLVKVSVNDNDFAQAKEIIEHWESQEIPQEPPSEITADSHSLISGRYRHYISFLLGLALGAAAVYWNLQSPVTQNAMDSNADGRFDEFYFYRSGLISKIEVDRNFDGKIDFITDYDHAGLAELSSADENFDGVFETTLVYQNNQVAYEKSDTNADGEIDLVTNYYQTEPTRLVTIYDLHSGRAKKEQRYAMGKLVSADWDSDGDGLMDTIITYDAYEEEVSRRPKPSR